MVVARSRIVVLLTTALTHDLSNYRSDFSSVFHISRAHLFSFSFRFSVIFLLVLCNGQCAVSLYLQFLNAC